MENTYKEQLRYLEEVVKFFQKAREIKCEFFYMLHISLIKSLIAHSEGKIEECKEYLNNIYHLHKKYKNEKSTDSGPGIYLYSYINNT